MKVIVDANIVFSAILKTNGKIADLLINSEGQFNFIAPNFLNKEIKKHLFKISKISGLTEEEVKEVEQFITKNIHFIDEELISGESWITASLLAKDIDEKDTPYIAFANHFDCILWTGDKKLYSGLQKKGFSQIRTTDELFKLKK